MTATVIIWLEAMVAEDIIAERVNQAIRAGLQGAAAFTWANTAKITADFFHSLIESRN